MIIEVPTDMFLQRLMITALKAKKIALNEESIRVFELFLSHNNPQFMQVFYQWDLETQLELQEISMVKVNEEFKALYMTSEAESDYFIADTKEDFNFIIDYIF